MQPRKLSSSVYILCVLVSTLLLSGCDFSKSKKQSPEKDTTPNILLIVLDDFGYNDLGANGNPDTPTPSLDQFASEGIRFTRHYTDATCSASRVALLTGKHPANFGFRPAHIGLNPDTPTLAKSLQTAGYQTQHIGKWHVGNATLDFSPSQLGFDHWFGFLTQFELKGPSKDGIQFRRPSYINPWLQGDDQEIKQHKGHLTDILTDKALEFLNQQSSGNKPWFLNLWYYAPHNPIQPAQRFKQAFPETDEGLYHALISQLDTNIGKVLAHLEKNGQAENTLVIILSDNGGTNQRTNNNAPFYGSKGYFFEGGVRTPLLIRWPEKITKNTVSNELVTIWDIFPTIAKITSAPLPSGLMGRDILTTRKTEAQALFWEYSTSEYHNYSVLSADGRWRLVHPFKSEAFLNDLETDPSGKTNVIQEYPQIAARLREEYKGWRHKTRMVNTRTATDIPGGGSKIEGNEVLRTPGYSGFSFAIAATPKAGNHKGTEVIADQPGRWRLQHSSAGLQLTILGHTITAPTLNTGQCNDIVVSSHYMISPLIPKANRALIDLYVNGKHIKNLRIEKPRLYLQDYRQPTYIGRDAEGQHAFTGSLSAPMFLNERIVQDSDAIKAANGISDLSSLCKQ